MFFRSAFAGDLPIQGTDVAARWDLLYNFLVWVSVFFFVAVIGAMIWFIVRYRHSVHTKTKYLTGNHLLEGVFIVLPTALLLTIFGWGWSVYTDMTAAPADAMEIKVVGKQWLWQFQYDNGAVTVNEVYVPIGRPVKFVMSSEDVLHAMFIPNFRIKQDVVPGMYSSVWFEAKVPGRHQIFCTEYCGTSHSGMLAQLVVLSEDQYKQFQGGKKFKLADFPLAGGEGAPDSLTMVQDAPAAPAGGGAAGGLAEQGRQVANAKGCIACHTADGSVKIGPSWKGIYGKTEEMQDGTQVVVDDNYIRESIENPQAKIVKGFPPSMPPFKGIVNETELNQLIAYIKSLK